MMKELRKELLEAISALPFDRVPIIRRSNNPNYLLTSDLPLHIPKNVLDAFIRKMTEDGWTVTITGNNWIEVDKKLIYKIGGTISGNEASCCARLLEKHPGNADEHKTERDILKAKDANKLEECCRSLHRSWAEALRRGDELPRIDISIFCDT